MTAIGSTNGDVAKRSMGATFQGQAAALAAILIMALALRCAFMFIVTDSANYEGVYYLRLAENIIAGRGYVGLRENGIQFLYPPLFPGLIAFGTALFGHAEVVARIIDIMLGSALVVPAFLIGRILSGDPAAKLAALLTAVHPFLIAMSTVILTETLYALLLLIGFYAAFVATRSASPLRSAALAGACFGLAYLVRPEGLIFMAIGALGLLVAQRRPSWSGARPAGTLVLCGALLAIPYMAWLTISAGQFLIEAKSAENYAQKMQLFAHVPVGEIYFGLNDDLTPKGLSLISNLEEIKREKVTPGVALKFALGAARQTLPDLVSRLAMTAVLGNPFLAGYAFLGFIIGLRRRELWLLHAALATIIAGTAFALFLAPTQSFQDRYLFPTLMPMLIWAAIGIALLSTWIERVSHRAFASSTGNAPRAVRAVAAGLLALPLILLPIGALHDVGDFSQGWGDSHTEKELGLWLKDHGGKDHPRLMDTSPVAAFYAGGALSAFPYTTSSRALAFIATQNIDFLVISSRAANSRPYFRDWIDHGVPDARARFMNEISDGHGGRSLVYRWAQ
jgi:4-amino-4-deoxy-L-arabinose transferase-like glycosyltransferase